MQEITESAIREQIRRQPAGFSGSTRITDLVDRLTVSFGIPGDIGLMTVTLFSKDPASMAKDLLEWRSKASEMDLLRGRIEGMVSETETLSSDERWANGLADKMRRAYYLPERETQKVFFGPDKGSKDDWWTVRLSKVLAQRVLSRPPMAAFVIAEGHGGMVAAVTHPSRGVGLPGGKLERGETAPEAAIREAREEGWIIEDVLGSPIHVEEADGFLCGWFWSRAQPIKMTEHKDKGRIDPLLVDYKVVSSYGDGNRNAVNALMNTRAELEADYGGEE